ncbi:hypothetical protein [Allosediminivita pacifica]|uniref:hypothetical protein n=1 Tax=Allosediminivita pacifica TaxID=1267769 RepID=UPI00147369EB|nr:hypothetical protein [Allosediminivita pacifica]
MMPTMAGFPMWKSAVSTATFAPKRFVSFSIRNTAFPLSSRGRIRGQIKDQVTDLQIFGDTRCSAASLERAMH